MFIISMTKLPLLTSMYTLGLGAITAYKRYDYCSMHSCNQRNSSIYYYTEDIKLMNNFTPVNHQHPVLNLFYNNKLWHNSLKGKVVQDYN